MPVHNRRPFYSDFAWAFDLLIDRPVAKECDAIAGWLVERGIYPGADLLDAGCGTGRYSIELARRGYVVGGVDASADLIAVARRAVGAHSVAASFDVGNMLALRSYDHSFVMRCWTQNELDSHLRAGGFNSIEWFGAYSPEVAPGSTDRLVAVGRLPGTRS